MANLETSYAGLLLKNPIVASSSGMTDTVEKVKKLAESGVAAVVLKSIFEEEILIEMEEMKAEMTGRPFIYPETFDYMDEDPHEDITRKYLNLISDCKKAVDIPVIASINAVSNQKWTYLSSEIEEAGADAIELNLFALPSDVTKTSAEMEDNYIDIVNAVVSQVKIPVTVKISHYFTAMGQMVKRLTETGIKGLVIFNRYYAPDIDIENEKLNSSFVLSSPSDISLPMRWTALLSDKLDIDIVATTGVHSGADTIKLLLAGASSVQIASTIYRHDTKVVGEMIDFITAWMDKKGYESIQNFKGKLSYKGQDNAASWERVQFMKEFKDFVK